MTLGCMPRGTLSLAERTICVAALVMMCGILGYVSSSFGMAYPLFSTVTIFDVVVRFGIAALLSLI